MLRGAELGNEDTQKGLGCISLGLTVMTLMKSRARSNLPWYNLD